MKAKKRCGNGNCVTIVMEILTQVSTYFVQLQNEKNQKQIQLENLLYNIEKM